MSFSPVRNLVATVAEASPAQFDDWRKAWRAAVDAGSAEPLLTFVARERGVAEDVFTQRLATALGWPYLEPAKLAVDNNGSAEPASTAARHALRQSSNCAGDASATVATRFLTELKAILVLVQQFEPRKVAENVRFIKL